MKDANQEKKYCKTKTNVPDSIKRRIKKKERNEGKRQIEEQINEIKKK